MGSIVRAGSLEVERLLDEPVGSGPDGSLRLQVDEAVEQVRHRGVRSRAAGWLRQLGLLADGSAIRLATGFRCSVTGTTLRTDCQLTSCRYHVDYCWSANCLLAYMHQQRIASLSIDEISFLYRVPSERVKQVIEEATQTLRGHALDVEAERSSYLSRQFNYLLTDRLCCVCESTVDETVPRNMTVESLGLVYCGKDCRDEKPPRVIELEVDKGIPIERILEWTFRRYRSLSLAEQALQMPRWLMYEAARRYLNRPLESFFPAIKQVQSQRRSALIRRTWHTPRWVAALTQQLRPTIDAARRFGRPTVQTEALHRQLAYLLDNV